MASTGKCRFCGSTVRSDERTCSHCGATNEGYIADTERTVFLPKTIEELKEYCAERGMPLLRMRFFIGEDFREPRAFGIYRDGDSFVVYKNKSDGSRSVRYHGPDEAYAVNELFMKLLDECHKRGIYPDGKSSGEQPVRKKMSRSRQSMIASVIAILLCLLLSGIFAAISIRNHKNDGYYRSTSSNLYYKYGQSWYYNDHDSWRKTEISPFVEEKDYYLGDSFDSDWGGTDFRQSETYRDIQESHSSSSSDYDSWDSSDTDWDSDW